jgi:hypothetical protein
MNFRSRVVGLTAAAGLVGGAFAMAAGPADAVTLNYITCSNVHGTASAKNASIPPVLGQGITNTNAPVKISVKMDTNTGGASDPSCTSDIGINTMTGIPTKFAGALTSIGPVGANASNLSCGPPTGTEYPPSGTVKTTYTNTYVSPVNGNTYTFASSMYISLTGSVAPNLPDSAGFSGIVTKNVGVGLSASGSLLQEPKAKVDGDGSGLLEQPYLSYSGPPYWNGNPADFNVGTTPGLQPTTDSALAGLACQNGTDDIDNLYISTQGNGIFSLVGLGNDPTATLNSSVQIAIP